VIIILQCILAPGLIASTHFITSPTFASSVLIRTLLHSPCFQTQRRNKCTLRQMLFPQHGDNHRSDKLLICHREIVNWYGRYSRVWKRDTRYLFIWQTHKNFLRTPPKAMLKLQYFAPLLLLLPRRLTSHTQTLIRSGRNHSVGCLAFRVLFIVPHRHDGFCVSRTDTYLLTVRDNPRQ
jgi:hypothetical protein